MDIKDVVPINTIKGSVSVPERLSYLNEKQKLAVLATWGYGTPYTSIVNFAITDDFKTIIFATPKNTKKYNNIKYSKYVSILIDNRMETAGNLLNTEAITIVGKARIMRKGKNLEELKKVYMKKHRDLEGFINAETTVLISVQMQYCVHVSRFQTVTVWDCK